MDEDDSGDRSRSAGHLADPSCPRPADNAACQDSLPFTIRLVDRDTVPALLPATFRSDQGDLKVSSRDVWRCIISELDLDRLSSIHRWLWVAGLPRLPRPLHRQLVLGRDLVITELMDMHLVWAPGRIFLKPVPRFLLEPEFWSDYLACRCPRGQACDHRRLRRRALGFLFSYTALVSHESDFRIALKTDLLPPEVRWPQWRTFVEQIHMRTHDMRANIDRRFYHGELRLSRLNKIYSLYQTPLRAYASSWDSYGAFFRDNFTFLASATVYIAVVLTAMQVGLATKALGGNDAFQSASSVFTVFAILGPLIAASAIVLVFCLMFVSNLAYAVTAKRRRLDRKRNAESP
ncbi:hypothetical protein CDD83_8243 [Cordyceps sp. RAO-2017]|nr:hypothetical protein CDD83_8243 [Cordyceps sp. RAO-2017]